MTNIAIFGSCRLGTWQESIFSNNSKINEFGDLIQPSIHKTNDNKLSLIVNPTGYSVSILEHLDLLKVFQEKIKPIETNHKAYREIHKYSFNPLIVGMQYDAILLEVCSRKVLFAPPKFARESAWEGETIPYKLTKYEALKDFGVTRLSYCQMDQKAITKALQEFVTESGLPANKIHIIGPYYYTQTYEHLDELPHSVIGGRVSLHNDLSASASLLGIQYHNFNDILQLNQEDVPCPLKSPFHLNGNGISRLSEYIKAVFA